jgi:hypothetical protein
MQHPRTWTIIGGRELSSGVFVAKELDDGDMHDMREPLHHYCMDSSERPKN